MIRNVLRAVALLCAMASPVLAGPACDAQFLDGRRPVLAHPIPAAVELCNDGYALLYDPADRILVYSAEHVTTASLDAGEGVSVPTLSARTRA